MINSPQTNQQMKKRKITLAYGIMSAPIHGQIEKADLNYHYKTIDGYEKCLSGLFHCRMNGIITDTQYSRILQKLNNKIVAHLNSVN